MTFAAKADAITGSGAATTATAAAAGSKAATAAGWLLAPVAATIDGEASHAVSRVTPIPNWPRSTVKSPASTAPLKSTSLVENPGPG
jgi:hypothetical protein